MINARTYCVDPVNESVMILISPGVRFSQHQCLQETVTDQSSRFAAPSHEENDMI